MTSARAREISAISFMWCGTRLHGRELAVKDVDVHASGGSEGELRASGRVRGRLSGGCELHVRGGAQANVSTTGGASVEVED